MLCGAVQCGGVRCGVVLCGGVEWSGVERSGVEWSGVERSRVEWSGVTTVSSGQNLLDWREKCIIQTSPEAQLEIEAKIWQLLLFLD